MRAGRIVRTVGDVHRPKVALRSKVARAVFVCSLAAAVFITGCWTVREAARPVVSEAKLPAGKELKVQVAGFDMTVTTYETAYGYTTVSGFGGPYYGPHGRYRSGFGTTTYSTTEYVPHTESTPVYRNRATDALERAGCIVQAKDPKYRIEVRFDGPYTESGDAWATAGWLICTVFTADYGAQNWMAKVKVHDLTTGKLLHEKDLTVRDEAVVWGPIPIFSPSFATRTSGNVMKGNCLMALTDLAIADAVLFLAAL